MDMGIAGKRALVLGASKAVTRPTSPVRCSEWTGAGSERCSEFGLNHRFIHDAADQPQGHSLTLSHKQAMLARVVFQLETIWGRNRLFLFH